MATAAPRFVQKVAALNRYLSEDFLGGPKGIKLAWVINLQKGGTLPFVAFLMWRYQNHSPAAWVYLGLHGSYGLIWLLKHFAFRDPNWEKRVTFGGAFMSVAMVLGPYWIAPYLLVSGVLGPRDWPSGAVTGISILLYALGVVIMVAADAQKFFTLRVKRGLITDGMFRWVRHPNYLGEMLLYFSFALLVGHWLPFVVLGIVWSQVFLTNMLMKEASMSRYPEWDAYKARTGMLLPRLFGRSPRGAARAPAPAP